MRVIGKNATTASGFAQRPSAADAVVYATALFGFGFCRAWIVACLAMAASDSAFFSGANWTYLVMGALAALFTAFATRKSLGAADRLHEHIAEATAVLAAASAAIAVAAAIAHSPLLALAGAMTGGIAAGMLQVLWGERFCLEGMHFSVVCSAGAAIATAMLLAFVPAWADIVACALFPAASIALLALHCRAEGIAWRTGLPLEGDPEKTERPAFDGDDGRTRDNEADDRAMGKLMFSIAIFSFLTRMFDAVPIGEHDPFSALGGSAVFALAIAGAAFLALAAAFKDRFDAAAVYRISIPVMVAGLGALTVFFDQKPALSVLVIGIGYEFFDILAWILFAHLSRQDRRGPLYIYGIGVSCMFAGMAAGILAGELIHTLVSNDFLQMSVVSVVCILSLVITGFMVLPESAVAKLATRETRESAGQGSENEGISDGERPLSLEDRCAAATLMFGLTPREGEILVLLAKGRTIAIIARDLQIAKGTARTHTERIYRKLDVHKQQELIDLVECTVRPQQGCACERHGRA